MGSCCSGPSRVTESSGGSSNSVGPICDPTNDNPSPVSGTGATIDKQLLQQTNQQLTGIHQATCSYRRQSKTMPYGASLHCTLSAHVSDVNGVAFGENSLATCGGDKTVRLWNASDFCELGFSPLKEHTYSVNGCTYSPNENILVTFSTDGKAVLWNVKVGDRIAVLTHPSQSSIRVCQFSPSGDLLATGSDDESLCLWDVATRKIIRTFEGHEASIPACAFSPDSALIVCGDVIGHLRVYDVNGPTQHHLFYEMNAHDLGVTCCAFSPNYRTSDTPNGLTSTSLLATCGFDNNLKLWEVTSIKGTNRVTMKLTHTLSGHRDSVMACCFSPDGQILASAAGDKTLRLWDISTGHAVFTILGHSRFVTSCAFSKDGRYLASGSNDKQVKVWRVGNQDQLLYEDDGAAAKSAPPVPVMAYESSQYYMKDLHEWTIADVNQWLAHLGMGQYIDTFQQHAIDGTELATLNVESLEKDLGIMVLGHRNKLARTIEELKQRPELQRKAAEKGVPDEYICPITREIMKEPVIASDGYTYEKAAILDWIQRGKSFSPMTNGQLSTTSLTANRSLKMLIDRYLESGK